jgi:hypothetical protein
MSNHTTTNEARTYRPAVPVIDTKQIASEPAVFTVEIVRVQHCSDGTSTTSRSTVGEYATRRRAQDAAAIIRGAVADGYFTGSDHASASAVTLG